MRQCVGDLGRIEPGVSKIHDSRSYIQTKITEKEEQGCAVFTPGTGHKAAAVEIEAKVRKTTLKITYQALAPSQVL